MNCKELFATDLGFRGFLSQWVADRRCPFPLADYLRELGLEQQADAAFWAATQPDREQYVSIAPDENNYSGRCGPFPAWKMVGTGKGWYWFGATVQTKRKTGDIAANELPHKGSVYASIDFPQTTPATDVTVALLDFLDNYKVLQ